MAKGNVYCGDSKCPCGGGGNPPELAEAVVSEPEPKLALPPGQSEATYYFEAGSAKELGRLVDEFIAGLDFNRVDVSSSYGVSFGLFHARSYQEGVVRTSIGPFSTYLHLTRRGPL